MIKEILKNRETELVKSGSYLPRKLDRDISFTKAITNHLEGEIKRSLKMLKAENRLIAKRQQMKISIASYFQVAFKKAKKVLESYKVNGLKSQSSFL